MNSVPQAPAAVCAPRQIGTRVIRRVSDKPTSIVSCDVCVVGSGAAGISAALESARLGNKVVIVEASPVLGGQAVNSLVGTFCGFYSNGPSAYRLVYGIASEMITDLRDCGALRTQRGRNTIIHIYDDIALSRWVEDSVRAAGITVLVGATIHKANCRDRRLGPIFAATRFGDVQIDAQHYVDASGDAVLSWFGGLEVKEPVEPIRGTQMMTLDGVDTTRMKQASRSEINSRLVAVAKRYDLVRHDGFAFMTPVPGVALVNMTHIDTPLDALGMSAHTLDGRAQANRTFNFLKTEFPEIFGSARVRSYGFPGIRQTRTIKAVATLTADQVRGGVMFDDAIARCSWPIELHDSDESSYWEEFANDHMHFVPLRCMIPDDLDNVVAAGRCIDADPVALSSVRVIGPCIAMGSAAAHALDLAGSSSVRTIDIKCLRNRLAENLSRSDPADLLKKSSGELS